ncbi:hypothetical protein B1A75_14775 [Geobacillus sp. LEMMY01]|nr:hypothetical protein B1A75_14775 [Geobacillus sp. LEMMY01]
MRIFLQWVGLVTFTIQENSHFLYPLFSLCIPILKSQVQLVVKSQKFRTEDFIHAYTKSLTRDASGTLRSTSITICNLNAIIRVRKISGQGDAVSIKEAGVMPAARRVFAGLRTIVASQLSGCCFACRNCAKVKAVNNGKEKNGLLRKSKKSALFFRLGHSLYFLNVSYIRFATSTSPPPSGFGEWLGASRPKCRRSLLCRRTDAQGLG